MKLCDTCIYRNNVEQLKPCIVYRDDCEYYEKERGDMTREDAIKILNKCRDTRFERTIYTLEEYHTATDMAIKALEQEPSGDLISRQAVDELSKELVHITRDKADFLCNFWERLQKLPPVNPQELKWIPVSERLPDKYDEYLVTKTTRDAEIEKGYHRFTYVEVMRYTRYSHWGLKTCGVVAWMPLPEPYKAESEE